MSTPTEISQPLDASGEWAAELAELQLRRRQAQAMGDAIGEVNQVGQRIGGGR